MCSTVQEQITTCGQNAIVEIGERTNIRPQKQHVHLFCWEHLQIWLLFTLHQNHVVNEH